MISFIILILCFISLRIDMNRHPVQSIIPIVRAGFIWILNAFHISFQIITDLITASVCLHDLSDPVISIISDFAASPQDICDSGQPSFFIIFIFFPDFSKSSYCKQSPFLIIDVRELLSQCIHNPCQISLHIILVSGLISIFINKQNLLIPVIIRIKFLPIIIDSPYIPRSIVTYVCPPACFS